MSEEIFIDSNVFIRFFTKDDPKKAVEVKNFFKKTLQNNQKLAVNFWVFAEIEFILRRQYLLSKKKILSLLRSIFTISNLKIYSKELIQTALLTFDKKNIDFVDALTAGFLKTKGIKKIATYDKHFDKFKDIERTVLK